MTNDGTTRILEYDLSLSKRFFFAGDHSFTLRIDGFNVLMQENKGTPTNSMSSTDFGKNTNDWGRRSFQISGKITW